MWLEELYKINKELDKEFIQKYHANEEVMRDKNILSLLTEIGELANETRCFKYWSIKPKSSDEIILEEYADVLIMVLTFSNYLKADIRYVMDDLKYRTIEEQFIVLYSSVCTLKENYSSDNIIRILGKVLTLGYSLGYNEEQIKDACLKKMQIVNKRLHSNY